MGADRNDSGGGGSMGKGPELGENLAPLKTIGQGD